MIDDGTKEDLDPLTVYHAYKFSPCHAGFVAVLQIILIFTEL
jgi:hypothetical protein